ncbi:MAG: hypothetical protein ABIG42_11090 [bacterium]
MRIICIATLFLITISFPLNGEDEKTMFDYFFLHGGGVFVHNENEPKEAFSYFAIPPIEPYSYSIDTGDMTRDGVLIAVMKGDAKHESRVDLVRIDPDLKLTPLFALIKREKLDDGLKIDRLFGDIDIDPSTKKVVFSVNERLSKVGVTEQAEYSSRIYQIPLRGGACETIGEFSSICEDLAAGGGIVAVIKPSNLGDSFSNLMAILYPGKSAWVETGVQQLSIKSVDLSENGKSMILLGKAQHGDNQHKLIRANITESNGLEVELLEEFAENEERADFRYTLSGESIMFRKNVTTPWGKTWLNFLYLEGNPPYPLVRFDYAAEFSPLKSRKINESKIEHIKAILAGDVKRINTSGHLIQCGTKSNSESIFVDVDNDNYKVMLFDHELNKLSEYQVDSQNNLHGIFWEDGTLYTVAQLDLGERLLSFESITYGKLIEQSSDGNTETHDLRLAWNIGGKMLGIEIPDRWMFIGGSDTDIYLVLKYPPGGAFPISKTVTPFYFLNRDDWMIGHPKYLPKAKKNRQYIVRAFEDDKGNLFMLDSLNSLVVKYNASDKKRSEIGWLPDSMPQLANPADFSIFDEIIHILDPINKRIVAYTIDGIPVKIIEIDSGNVNVENSKFGSIQENGFSLVNLDSNELIKFEYSQTETD